MSNTDLVKQSLHLIDNWLDYQTYSKEIPGVAVGIFYDNEIIFKKEYGYADLENKIKLTDQHLFRIASHSKLFTATAIMKLYYNDKLSIDDRVSKYLPWFTSEKDKNLEQVRIYHLLTHSSGVTRDGKTAHWTTHKFPEIDKIIEQVKEGVSFFQTSELLKYSNFGYTILGQIIEKVSGKSYAQFIEEEILKPLEMKSTIIDVNQENINRHAFGYTRKLPDKKRKKIDHVQAKIMASATGLSSTVEDLIKFYKAHMFGNNKLFPDYIKREMQRIQFKAKKADWGWGFAIRAVPGSDTKLVGHGGGYPGFITQSGLLQDEKLILVVLTNAIDGPARTLIMGILAILNHLKKHKKEFEIKKDEELLDLKDVIGFYASEWSTVLFSQIGNRLVSLNPHLDDPIESFQIFKHKEAKKFIAPKTLPFASPGESIEFIDSPEGEKILIDSHGGQVNRFHFSY
ncbi:MAG: serine hydrolase domain-containing protein [Candidatus Heimdallarchaeaceae archaeon]